MNIDRIIKEEINKFILSEAVDFTNLRAYANQLNSSLGNIRNLSENGAIDNRLRKFLYDLVVYCIQIIAAINRCMQANNLNEGIIDLGRLSDYGINIPSELGGSLWSDAKRGYYNTRNFLQRNNMYNGTYGNAKAVNSNSVPSVKLSQLLQQLPRWKQSYANIYAQYNLRNNAQLSTDLNKILGINGIMENINNEYQTQIRQTSTTP